jgi:hypothetical protein
MHVQKKRNTYYNIYTIQFIQYVAERSLVLTIIGNIIYNILE